MVVLLMGGNADRESSFRVHFVTGMGLLASGWQRGRFPTLGREDPFRALDQHLSGEDDESSRVVGDDSYLVASYAARRERYLFSFACMPW